MNTSQTAAEFVEKRKAVQKAELGFEVETAIAERAESLRGKYDVTRLERDHPALVNLITWLLSLPGMTHQAISEACGKGVCWETVAAIAASRRTSIREFKLRAAAKLQLVLEAAMPGLMQRAAAGKLGALDVKLLTDAFLQLSGEGHVVRFEGVQNDPRRERVRAVLSGSAPMVLEAEEIDQGRPALPVALAHTVHANANNREHDL